MTTKKDAVRAAPAGLVVLVFDELKSRKGVPHCFEHIKRLERLGKFPQHIQLSPNRIGWLESEIDQWLRDLVTARGAKPRIARRRVGVS